MPVLAAAFHSRQLGIESTRLAPVDGSHPSAAVKWCADSLYRCADSMERQTYGLDSCADDDY